jgi:hypothetical protein
MARNEILDELHATRAKLLEDAGGDLKRYIREADERLKASDRRIAKLARKPKQRRKETG